MAWIPELLWQAGVQIWHHKTPEGALLLLSLVAIIFIVSALNKQKAK